MQDNKVEANRHHLRNIMSWSVLWHFTGDFKKISQHLVWKKIRTALYNFCSNSIRGEGLKENASIQSGYCPRHLNWNVVFVITVSSEPVKIFESNHTSCLGKISLTQKMQHNKYSKIRCPLTLYCWLDWSVSVWAESQLKHQFKTQKHYRSVRGEPSGLLFPSSHQN